MRRYLLLLTLALAPRLILYSSRALYGVVHSAYLETFDDFSYYYIWGVERLSRGELPYRDFAYSYPPLFIYTLLPPYLAAGPEAAGLVMVLSDALTALAVYRLSALLGGARVGMAAGVSYALNPLALLYESYLWLSQQPMLLLLLLSLGEAASGKPVKAGFLYGLSILYRQQALLALPALLLTLGRGVRLRGLAPVLALLLAASLPFLILSPGSYVAGVTYEIFIPSDVKARPQPNATFLLPVEFEDPSGRRFVITMTGYYGSRPGGGGASCTLLGEGLYSASYSCFGDGFKYLRILLKPGPYAELARVLSPAAALIPFIAFWRRGYARLALAAYLVTAPLTYFSLNRATLTYRYYLLPGYGLLAASSRRPEQVMSALGFSLLSIAMPPSPLQDVAMALAVSIHLTLDAGVLDRLLKPRPVRFVAVGGMGYLVGVSTLQVLTLLGANYMEAAAAASLAALLNNFAWGEWWAFNDLRPGSLGYRLAAFIASRLGSLALGLASLAALVELLSLPPLPSFITANSVATAANYFSSRRLAWA